MLYLLLYWTFVWYCENATPVRDKNHYAAIKKLFLVPQILKNSFFWFIFKSFAPVTYLGNWSHTSHKRCKKPQICVYIKITLEVPIVLLFFFPLFLFFFFSKFFFVRSPSSFLRLSYVPASLKFWKFFFGSFTLTRHFAIFKGREMFRVTSKMPLLDC